MTEHFEKHLFRGEEILWTGESSPEGPPPDRRANSAIKRYSLATFLLGTVTVAMTFINKYSGTSLIGGLVFAVLAFFIAVVLWINAEKYRQEIYCLTNMRFLVIDERSRLKGYELVYAQEAEVSGENGEYGSVLVFTDRYTKKDHHRKLRSSYTAANADHMWKVRGIRDCNGFCELVNKAIADVDKNVDLYDLHTREPAQITPELLEEERKFREMLTNKQRRRNKGGK
ncbi:MAG: hypothetical protein IKO27_00980 [Ruminococcus sp.]|nr:hypothetical protein [Ruminococcus sp.]